MDTPLRGARAGRFRRTCRRTASRGADGASPSGPGRRPIPEHHQRAPRANPGRAARAAQSNARSGEPRAVQPPARRAGPRRRRTEVASIESAAGRHRDDARARFSRSCSRWSTRSLGSSSSTCRSCSRSARRACENLQNLMPRADVAISEKYRLILEAYQIELDYGQTLDAYEGRLGTGADARTVEFAQLGRVSLMYRTLDGSETGYWDANQKTWVVDNSYARSHRESHSRRERRRHGGFVDRTCSSAAGGAVVMRRIRTLLPVAAVVFAAAAFAQQPEQDARGALCAGGGGHGEPRAVQPPARRAGPLAGGRDRVDRTPAGRDRHDEPPGSAAHAADGRYARSFRRARRAVPARGAHGASCKT